MNDEYTNDNAVGDPAPVHGWYDPDSEERCCCVEVYETFMDECETRYGNLSHAPTSPPSVKILPVAFLVGRPHDELPMKTLVPNLKEYDAKSGMFLDIVCLGVADTEAADLPTRTEVRKFDGSRFVEQLNGLYTKTSYRHSGGTDFLLASAVRDPVTGSVILDFSHGFAMNLEDAVKRGLIKSPQMFLDEVIQKASTYEGENFAWDFGDRKKLQAFGKVFITALSFLPSPLKEIVEKGMGPLADLVTWRATDLSPKKPRKRATKQEAKTKQVTEAMQVAEMDAIKTISSSIGFQSSTITEQEVKVGSNGT